jgi:hypothetical protein
LFLARDPHSPPWKSSQPHCLQFFCLLGATEGLSSSRRRCWWSVVIIRPQAVVMASTVRPRSPPGRRNRRGRRPGVLELDEHQVLAVVVDIFEGLHHVVVAANATVDAGPVFLVVMSTRSCGSWLTLLNDWVLLWQRQSELISTFCIRSLFSWWLFLRVLCTECWESWLTPLRCWIVLWLWWSRLLLTGLLGEIAVGLSVVGSERDLVLMGERPKP